MGAKRKELNIKKEKEEGKHQVANGERERERDLCEAKCFCNCVGDLVVQLISKTFVFSIFLGLWYKYALDVLG